MAEQTETTRLLDLAVDDSKTKTKKSYEEEKVNNKSASWNRCWITAIALIFFLIFIDLLHHSYLGGTFHLPDDIPQTPPPSTLPVTMVSNKPSRNSDYADCNTTTGMQPEVCFGKDFAECSYWAKEGTIAHEICGEECSRSFGAPCSYNHICYNLTRICTLYGSTGQSDDHTDDTRRRRMTEIIPTTVFDNTEQPHQSDDLFDTTLRRPTSTLTRRPTPDEVDTKDDFAEEKDDYAGSFDDETNDCDPHMNECWGCGATWYLANNFDIIKGHSGVEESILSNDSWAHFHIELLNMLPTVCLELTKAGFNTSCILSDNGTMVDCR